MKYLKRFFNRYKNHNQIQYPNIEEIKDILIEDFERYGDRMIIQDNQGKNNDCIRIWIFWDMFVNIKKYAVEESDEIFLPIVNRLRKFGFNVKYSSSNTDSDENQQHRGFFYNIIDII